MSNHRVRRLGAALLAATAATVAAFGQETRHYKATISVDHPAIAPVRLAAADPVSHFAARVATGEIVLPEPSEPRARLRAVLAALDVPADSQMLVFSKTSVQAARVSPERPRAIYFNDAVAVAHVPGAPALELIALDPARGPVFYTLTGDAGGRPRLSATDTCLSCHHGPNTAGVPGLYVGSVVPGPTGAPLRDDTAIITDHTSAFAERWGGWYVTARRGEQRDRANAVASNPADPSSLVREARQNLTTLLGLIDPAPYLEPTSDIVALMTFEHQTQAANLITRVAWQARIAERAQPGAALRSPALAADLAELVSYLAFEREAPLAEPVEGVSSFARTFPARGPRDGQGRSLRDFDLQTRLFRYPLSYLIYSPAFDALPEPVRAEIYRQLHLRLTAPAGTPGGARAARAVLEIVAATKSGLPAFWGRPVAPPPE